MAEKLYFSRDAKLYVELMQGTTSQGIWEVPVLDGFSFSQATNTSEIGLTEMENTAGQSRRGRRLFTDSLAPAEWSFSTYIRPTKIATNQHHLVDGVLWAAMAGADSFTEASSSGYEAVGGTFERDVDPVDSNGDAAASGASGPVLYQGTDVGNLTFVNSNRSALPELILYFVFETDPANPMVYRLGKAVVNEASIDFDVDGIATVNWSGFAKEVEDMTSLGEVTVADSAPSSASATEEGDIWINSTASADLQMSVYRGSAWSTSYDVGVTSTDNFIRNRVTQLAVTNNDGANDVLAQNYTFTLTGGNITINNNITYLVPEELGTINKPLDAVTGPRSVSGNFTCYLVFDSGQDKSAEFFKDLTNPEAGLTKVVNDFALTFKIGGTDTSKPRLNLTVPKCHLDVPVHQIEDVISLETGFGAYTEDFNVASEMTAQIFGVTV